MSISFFEPPPIPPDEEARNRAVLASGIIDSAGDPELSAIVSDLRSRFGALMSLISAIVDDTQHIVAATSMPLGAYSRRNSFCGHVIASSTDLFCVPDLTQDHRFADNPWVNGDHAAFRFYAAARLMFDGQPVGGLCVIAGAPRDALSSAEQDILRHGAHEVMSRLGRLRSGSG